MKARWIKLCAFILAILGFTSCGTARKAAREAAAKEKESLSTTEVEPDTLNRKIPAKPEIRVMYGPPPSYYKKTE